MNHVPCTENNAMLEPHGVKRTNLGSSVLLSLPQRALTETALRSVILTVARPDLGPRVPRLGSRNGHQILKAASGAGLSRWLRKEQLGRVPSTPPLRGRSHPVSATAIVHVLDPQTRPLRTEMTGLGTPRPYFFLCARHTVHEDSRSPPRFHARSCPCLVGMAPRSTRHP